MENQKILTLKERKKCFQNIPNEAKNSITEDSFSQTNINYPVLKYPISFL